jgi:hypothetical protein
MKIRLLPASVALLLGAAVFASSTQSHAACAPGPKSTFQDNLLDKLAGKWSLTGNMMGRELLQKCAGAWVFHHKFLRLDCKETKNPPVLGVRYESTMYIGCSSASQQYVAILVDIFGAGANVGLGRRTGNTVQFTWAYPDSAFENTFTWNADSGTWTSLLRQKNRSGKWESWGQKTLRPE